MTPNQIVAAIVSDNYGGSGWNSDEPTRRVLYILCFNHFNFWVREDGSWVSGVVFGKDRFAFRPNLFDRWRIRSAIRQWERRQ